MKIQVLALLCFLTLTLSTARAEPAGLMLDVVFTESLAAEKERDIRKWVDDVSGSVASVYGRFPNPEAKVVIKPASFRRRLSDSPVPFGRVTRWDGETIELQIDASRPIEEFYADWTATHEFSHLMLPYLNKEGRWISEGFATYYQNVLMARSGNYTPEFAWQRLTDGFARGRNSRPDLSPNQAADIGVRSARMKIYWSGAAIALMADVELRRRSAGKESLDSVLGELQLCCLPSARTWSGRRLFERLDSFIDEPLFIPLYRRYAKTTGYPDPALLLRKLGVDGQADAEFSTIASDIMR
jgi:predicted metalloprotease with PDZ domain